MNRRLMRLINVLVVAVPTALVAQDSVVTGPPLAWPTRPAYYVLLVLPSQSVPVGRTAWAHAMVFDSMSSRYRWPVRWTSSDRTVLSVAASGDSAVALHGHRVGRVVVTAASGPAVASGVVYVGSIPRARSVGVVPARARFRIGDYIRLLAEPRDAAGRRLPGTFLGWSWSDSAVVQLVGMPEPTEVVFRARAVGDATVLAALHGRIGRARLHVDP